ncbi:hypothetical protein RUND412_002238 [Rhizina undulata]
MQCIRTVVHNNKIHDSDLGYSEPDTTSLYIAQALIGPDGDMLQHRRKIKPMHPTPLPWVRKFMLPLGRLYYPPPTTLKYLDAYTNVADPNVDIVSLAYAIEIVAYILALFEIVTKEGAKNKKNALPEKRPGSLVRRGGKRIVENPSRNFEGLVIDLEETHLSKALAE